MLALASVGVVAAPVLWVWRDRWPGWFFQISTAAGSVLLGLCVYFERRRELAVRAADPLGRRVQRLLLHPGTDGRAARLRRGRLRGRPRRPSAGGRGPTPPRTGCLSWPGSRSPPRWSRALVSARRKLEVEREALLIETLELARTDPLTGLRQPAHLARGARPRARAGPPRGTALRRDARPRPLQGVQRRARPRRRGRAPAGAGDDWGDAVRPSDTLARYGGEEFALLLPACDIDAAAEVVERLRTMVPDGEHCSAGLACWDGHGVADGPDRPRRRPPVRRQGPRPRPAGRGRLGRLASDVAVAAPQVACSEKKCRHLGRPQTLGTGLPILVLAALLFGALGLLLLRDPRLRPGAFLRLLPRMLLPGVVIYGGWRIYVGAYIPAGKSSCGQPRLGVYHTYPRSSAPWRSRPPCIRCTSFSW